MTEQFQDDRIRFYLKNRADIREWANIEHDVTQATRDLLASIHAVIDERLLALDSTLTSSRWDGGPYERIRIGRPSWPSGFGIVLEWERAVDPFGGNLPKLGVLFVADDAARKAERERVATELGASSGLEALGYKLNPQSVWPALRRVAPSQTWWQEPDAWLGKIVDDLMELCRRAAGAIEAALAKG